MSVQLDLNRIFTTMLMSISDLLTAYQMINLSKFNNAQVEHISQYYSGIASASSSDNSLQKGKTKD